MYPHVVQFETRRQQFARDNQLTRERRQAQTDRNEAKLATQSPANSRADREHGVLVALLPRLARQSARQRSLSQRSARDDSRALLR